MMWQGSCMWAARSALQGVQQQVVRLAGGAVLGPDIRAGGGPTAWACKGYLHLLCSPKSYWPELSGEIMLNLWRPQAYHSRCASWPRRDGRDISKRSCLGLAILSL